MSVILSNIKFHNNQHLNALESLLTKCGFRIQYKTYFFSLIWLPIGLVRVLPNKFGIKKENTPKKKKTEHMAANPGLSRTLQRLLNWETGMIRNGKEIPFGTSCMIIARKTSHVSGK